MESFKIGVLRETKDPPDRRVALPPDRIIELQKQHPNVSVVIQPSGIRCFADEEFTNLGIQLQEDLSDCDLLIGVKEVKIEKLIPNKTYLFFAHVAKEQPYNRGLLKAILANKISLLDYEYLTDQNGVRLIAFGRWAGIVGAYNGLRGWGMVSEKFTLKPAHQCRDRAEMDEQISDVILDHTRILVSGGGRVAKGAMETLKRLNVREVLPQEFLHMDYDEPVICRIDPEHYVARADGEPFDYAHFFENPRDYKSIAAPYFKKTDLYIAAHYWDPESPRMFELHDLKSNCPSCKLQFRVIADISCDIDGSVPTTTHPTTIAEPFYWYGDDQRILMMTVDNLPGELPRDASMEFSGVLIDEIIPRIVKNDPDGVIQRATITNEGHLSDDFAYLKDYATGED